jgi:hypothetical protein
MNNQPNDPKGRLPADWWLPTLGGIFIALLILVSCFSLVMAALQ